VKVAALGVALLSLALPAGASARAHRVPPAKHVRSTAAAPNMARAPSGRAPVLRALPRSRPALRRAKAAAERRRKRHPTHSRRASTAGRIRARAALTAGPSAPGLRASDGLFGVPPDTTGAIGPGHFVEEVNDGVAVYRRSDLGRVAGPLINELFMAPPSGTFVTDPQMQWDQRAGRWFYLAAAFTADLATSRPVGPNYLLYGFSRTSDPRDLVTGWCRYRIQSGSAPSGAHILDDFPKLGHDDNHLIFGTNAFAIEPEEDAFVTARIYSVPKPPSGPLLGCPAAAAATVFGSAAEPLRTADGDLAVTPIPANTTDAAAAGYVVAADDATTGPKNELMTWHVGGTRTAPALVEDGNIAVAEYRVPPAARQFVFPPLDTLDTRLTTAVAHADPAAGGAEAVWTQHTVDPGNGRVTMRWYELVPSDLTARQEGAVSDPGLDVFNGGISPSSGGSAAGLVYNRSGPLLLPELRARSHSDSMAPGATGGGLLLARSEEPDYDLSCALGPACRWGDYSGASPDPLDPSRVWVAGQRIARPGGLLPNWTTGIASLDVSAP
jgi:hypothetical protein